MDYEYSQNEIHKLVLIEYQDGRPFSVITAAHMESTPRPHFWDFDWSERDGQIYFDLSGCGGRLVYLVCSRDWEGAEPVEVWADGVPFINHKTKRRISSRNALRRMGYILLDEPKPLHNSWHKESTTNPFEVAIEGDTTECIHCGRIPTDSVCEHLRWCDECGDYYYVADRSFNFSDTKCEHTDDDSD